jgi:GxxExxY protein
VEKKKVAARVFLPIPPGVELVGKQVLDAAYAVHTALGPGLLESVYETCLAFELQRRGVIAETEVAIPVKYRTVVIETGLRLDLWVERKVIVECKAVETIHSLHQAQLLTYLKITECRLGFLMNFNVKRLKDGVQRMVL